MEATLYGLLNAYTETLDSDRRVLLDQYRAVDIARKVVGVGSVGTRSWMVLLLGRDIKDPLFLQAKEAGTSVLESHSGTGPPDQSGARVVEGQRLMQTVGDIFLGWLRVDGIDGRQRDFYVRQLRDWKGSLEVESMVPSGLRIYAELCGWTLARAHARSGDRIAIAGYLGRRGRSSAHWSGSRRPMRTRTRGTTGPSSKRSPTAGWQPSQRLERPRSKARPRSSPHRAARRRCPGERPGCAFDSRVQCWTA